MKKTLLFPLFALPLLALASCRGDSIPNRETVDAVKALLAKQDLSPVTERIFSATFFQNYDVFSSVNTEKYQATKFHSYRGGGAFGCVYKVTQQAYEEAMGQGDPDFFDFFARGEGGYGLLQSASVSSVFYERDGEDVRNEPGQNRNFLQNVQVNFGETEVQVASTLLYSEGNDGGNTHSKSFNGVLGKAALFDSISVRSLSDLFARTNLYDGQRSCEAIDRIYGDVVASLTGKNDKELNDFILKNNLEIREGDGSVLVTFRVGDGEIRAALSSQDIIPGTLEGTLTYDKDSGAFTGFDYRIIHLQSEKDEANGRLYSASMEFSAVGYSKNEEFEGDIYITPNPERYEDGDAFIVDMTAGIIPELV